jgi:hypothetical protein
MEQPVRRCGHVMDWFETQIQFRYSNDTF